MLTNCRLLVHIYNCHSQKLCLYALVQTDLSGQLQFNSHRIEMFQQASNATRDQCLIPASSRIFSDRLFLYGTEHTTQ